MGIPLLLFTGRSAFSTGIKKKIGILKETKNRWECRVPLTPENIKELRDDPNLKDKLEFYIQPSRKRIFQDAEYIKAGASVENDLKDCDFIMGVKEVPSNQLIPNKSYIFFSHTHKGQPRNMPLLSKICSNGISLHDYELIKDKHGKRLVAFGRFAGYSGIINAFNGLGDILLSRGIRTPFIHVPLAHHFRNLIHVKEEMKLLSEDIREKGISKDANPIVFTFTGNGNVSKGAQEIFKLIPHEWIDPKDLKFKTESGELPNDRVYGCLIEAKDYCKRKDGDPFIYEDYLNNPEAYESHFHESIAPFSTVIVNGIYWEEKYPGLLTKDQMKNIQSNENSKLLSIADISCDIDGSIDFMGKASTIDEPFYYYNARTDKYERQGEQSDKSVQIMSIDNLPTELPEDSSIFFGNHLKPLIASLVGLENNEIVENSKITNNGAIMPRFGHLNRLLKQEKRILILGSGYVVPPVIDFFFNANKTENGTIVKMTIGTNSPEEAKEQFGDSVEVIEIDVTKDTNLLNTLIKEFDIVISLVTANLHVPIAEICIKNKKNLVTASYISTEMENLNTSAESSGVLLLNEIGLDPGLDHLAAMKVIDECKERGEVIESFVSWCGGLPAPEFAADNPFAYKFSWSPRGVLLATQNSAQFLENGQIQNISSENLLKSAKEVKGLHPAMIFEGIPNRDSLKYIDLYGLNRVHLKTMFRGTLRYKGFCELMESFKSLGFMDQTTKSKQQYTSWSEFTNSIVNESTVIDPDTKKTMEWLGLFSTESVNLSVFKSNLDGFCHLLQEKLAYTPSERDMTLLHHQFIVFNPATLKRRQIEVKLCEFGAVSGSTAMARTVGVPVALAAWNILKKEINAVGVRAPLEPAIYNPILKDLPIKFTFTSTDL